MSFVASCEVGQVLFKGGLRTTAIHCPFLLCKSRLPTISWKNKLKRMDIFLCYFSCNKIFLTPNTIEKTEKGKQNMKYTVHKENFYLSQSHCNIASAGDGAFAPVASVSSPKRAGGQWGNQNGFMCLLSAKGMWQHEAYILLDLVAACCLGRCLSWSYLCSQQPELPWSWGNTFSALHKCSLESLSKQKRSKNGTVLPENIQAHEDIQVEGSVLEIYTGVFHLGLSLWLS